jgi:8-oxo-dGTP pyrophosphatase MutT (NUDIX family)
MFVSDVNIQPNRTARPGSAFPGARRQRSAHVWARCVRRLNRYFGDRVGHRSEDHVSTPRPASRPRRTVATLPVRGRLQPTDDGCLLVARGSSSTAAPGRWQLPGGSVEPPADHKPLDEATLRREAARELVEETRLDMRPDDLTLRLVTRGETATSVSCSSPRPCQRRSSTDDSLGWCPQRQRWAGGRRVLLLVQPGVDRHRDRHDTPRWVTRRVTTTRFRPRA